MLLFCCRKCLLDFSLPRKHELGQAVARTAAVGGKFVRALCSSFLGVAAEKKNFRLSTGSLFALWLKVQRGHDRVYYRQAETDGALKCGPVALRQAPVYSVIC